MGDGDPILVFCYESDIWIGDFSLAHLVGPVVYLDPPFAVTSRRMFRQYAADSFNTSDIPRLDNALRRLHRIKADFLVSYADSPEARTLSKRWNSIRLPVRRHVASFGTRRRNAYEWFISNCRIPDEIRGLMASTYSRFPE